MLKGNFFFLHFRHYNNLLQSGFIFGIYQNCDHKCSPCWEVCLKMLGGEHFLLHHMR